MSTSTDGAPLGRVVVTEGGSGLVSRAVRNATQSPWTHAFVITGEDELTEAWFPRVRSMPLGKRMYALAQEGRRHIALELPDLTAEDRQLVAAKARSYVGRRYDVAQVLLYYALRRFWRDGDGTLVCSRLVTASYRAALGPERGDLFPPEFLAALPPELQGRRDNLINGYATPVDLLYSCLLPVEEADHSPRALTPSSHIA